jgi:hypothetical protein
MSPQYWTFSSSGQTFVIGCDEAGGRRGDTNCGIKDVLTDAT